MPLLTPLQGCVDLPLYPATKPPHLDSAALSLPAYSDLGTYYCTLPANSKLSFNQRCNSLAALCNKSSRPHFHEVSAFIYLFFFFEGV